jgi:hypothetical protein
MTEDKARVALRGFVAVGDIEHWIAERSWTPAPDGGWKVRGRLHGWRFAVKPVAGGVQVTMSAPGEAPAPWFVPAG